MSQSVTVFAAAFALIPIIKARGWSSCGSGFLCYLMGAGAAWALVELFILAHNLSSGWKYTTEFGVLFATLKRSTVDRSEYFSAYRGSLFPLLAWKFSPAYTMALLFALIMLACRFRRRGWPAFSKPAGVLGFAIIAVLLLIDFRTGPKFSRTYFLLIPFATMFLGISCYSFWLTARGLRWWIGRGALAMALVHAFFAIGGLRDQASAFLSVRDFLLESSGTESPRLVFAQDSYLPYFSQLIESNSRWTGRPDVLAVENLCASGAVLNLSPSKVVVPRGRTQFNFSKGFLDPEAASATVLVGPNIPSVLNLPDHYTEAVALELAPGITRASGQCSNRVWTATLKGQLPFFSHYPFLALEDPRMTYVMRKNHTFGWNDYKNGLGRVSIWEVEYKSLAAQPVNR
jgi:hypothetical protein